jgi:NADPH2:quinone reductase
MRGIVTDPAGAGGLRITDDLPEPRPAPNELVLSVRAFSINFGEQDLIRQRPDGWRPGQDVAGVVLTAAADGSGPPPGTRVVAYPEWEGWAQRIPVPTAWVAPIDDTVSYEQAAALPVAGLTALRALRAGGPALGRNVLITGATGGVGHLAAQLAVIAGATVTALVSGPQRIDEARDLGVHHVVTALDEPGLGPFHIVLDGRGGPALVDIAARLAPDATVLVYGSGGGPAPLRLTEFYRAGAYNAKIIWFISTVPEQTKGEDLASLVDLVATGRLVPRLGWTADWTHTADAFAAMDARQIRGKAVLTLT